MQCPKCREEINNKQNYCYFCGFNIKKNKRNKKTILLAVILLIIFLVIGSIETAHTELNKRTNKESNHIIEKNSQKKEAKSKKNEKTSNIKINIKSEKKQNIKVGDKIKIKYSISPWLAKSEKATWTSSNDNVAHVYDNGEIIGISPGSAEITITVGKAKETVIISVSQLSFDKEGSLKDIAQVYYLNEARGNSEYFGKIIKVTGTIGKIDVDDSVLFNMGVTIWLKDNEAKYNLACNNKQGIIGVSEVNRGEQISVIGEMDTLTNNFLTLDNCQIYK